MGVRPIVELPRGISRHVARVVNYEGSIYALKELPHRYAVREYRLLRHLAAQALPVVDVVGLVSGRVRNRAGASFGGDPENSSTQQRASTRC